MNDDHEVLDLVDKNDHVIGTILRSEIGQTNAIGFLRAAEAFIQNSQGQLWIPRRQMNKRIAPGGLDYSMGEHIQSGETYMNACIRGFDEELNMAVDKNQIEFINKFAPKNNLDYFRTVYLYKSDHIPRFNPQDFSEYNWLSPKELLNRLRAGEPAKASMPETIEFLIRYLSPK